MTCIIPSTTTPEQVLLQFFDHLDERRYDALQALMTPDAVWVRQGRRLQGRAAIRAALDERSPTQRVRHLVTNLLVRAAGVEAVQVSNYMTALRFDSGMPVAGPVTIAGPFRMSLVTSTLVPHAGAWRIAEQAIEAEFAFVGA